MVLNPLNPAAGDVPIPNDPKEVEAALRAGPVTYRIFPYLQWRYGERGRRFTQSDSAWLAWLVRHDQSRVIEQILWLRSVLSNRGMPSWILEVHLIHLFKELVRSLPEKEPQYDKLVVASHVLRQQRRDVMTDQDWDKLAIEFAIAVEREPTSVLIGIGKLLVAAVIDERLGVVNAVSSLEHWLTDVKHWRQIQDLQRLLSPALRRILDSRKFISRWNESLQKTIVAARATKSG